MATKELFREYLSSPLRKVMSFRDWMLTKAFLAGQISIEQV